jgi:hypothetical protein
MLPDMHRHLKVVCAEDGVSMNTFVTKAIENEFVARDERIDEAAVDEAEKEIKEHGTISLKEFKTRLGI